MPAPLADEIRRQIVERHEGGETLKAISKDLHLSYNTVRNIWAHWCKHQTVSPNYQQAHQTGTRRYQEVYPDAIEIKRQHPAWASQTIRLELKNRHPNADLPSVRTLQRWFKQAGINRAAKVKQNTKLAAKPEPRTRKVYVTSAKDPVPLVDETDDLYPIAVDLVRQLNKASISLLQRRLRIGYTRASKLIDKMEEHGVIGPAIEASPRPRPKPIVRKTPVTAAKKPIPLADGTDDLYPIAVDMVRRLNKASISLLQRRLRIGYARASDLIDRMEEHGVIGPAKEGSSKPRNVIPI